jgi:thiamine-phosphate pyrophosphorylase
VHLGEASLPVREVTEATRGAGRVGRAEFLVGASCHSLDAARRAAEDGAGYMIFGPVFATPSKAAFGAPQGVRRLAEVCRAVRIPVLAIGGVTENNYAECLEAGASGIAGIRLFQRAGNLAELLAKMR